VTFDHHCLWMGTCIGEHNKLYFFLYIIFQLVQCMLAVSYMIKVVCENKSFGEWILRNFYMVVFIVVSFYFIVFLVILLCFHVFLCVNNLTTCTFNAHFLGEAISWEKISYLSSWPIEYGSPFSNEVLANIEQCCCYKKPMRSHIEWSMPKQLPNQRTKGTCFIQLRSLFKWICS